MGSTVALHCPYCQKTIRLKLPRSGRFSPRCPQCAKRFSLIVHDENGEQVEIQPLNPVAAEPNATVHPGSSGPARPVEIPKLLGGYELIQQIGKGGMGTVYVARQLSLQREVALKVLKTDWNDDATFVTRFQREAHAAAQLSHHNVVQIFDVGKEGQFHYFSMELVRGTSLAKLIKQKGTFDAETAADYVLQAARGLHDAHQKGLVHRDVKPDNLLLNDQGVVKVADLGLVKSIDTAALDDSMVEAESPEASPASPEVTKLGAGMGTPSWLAPEQARDASKVDARADIYSLGCTFYALLTGQPPFRGESAMDVMIQHLSAPLRLPESIPEEIRRILAKMMEKKPADRYDNLQQLIEELEQFLGQRRSQSATPRSEDITQLQALSEQLSSVSLTQSRRWAIQGFFAVCALMVIVGLLASLGTLIASGFLLALLTPLLTLAYHAISSKSTLAMELRTFVLSTRPLDLITAMVGFLLLFLGLSLFGLLNFTGFCLLIAFFLILTFQMLVERPWHRHRAAPLQQLEQLMQQLRYRGWTEEDLYRLVAFHAGQNWEDVFESLFGYDKLEQVWQSTWPQMGDSTIKHRGNARHVLIRWLRHRRERREAVPEAIPEGQTLAVAAATQQQIGPVVTSPALPPPSPPDAIPLESQTVAAAPPASTEETKVEPEKKPEPEPEKKPEPAQPQVVVVQVPAPLTVEKFPVRKGDDDRDRFGALVGLWDTFLGPRIRFLFGCLLLGGFFWWVHQQKVVDLKAFNWEKIVAADWFGGKPLSVPGVSTAISQWVSSLSAAAAGLVIILSAFLEVRKTALLFLAGAAVMVLGESFGIPAIGKYPAHWVSMMAGGGIALFGLFFGSMTDD